MSPQRRSVRSTVLLTVTASLIAMTFSSPSAWAQFPRVVVTVGDTTALPGETNTVISIYLDNYQDSIAGFNLWIQLDRPDLIRFQTDAGISIDTTYWICNEYDPFDTLSCIDSTLTTPLAAYDTFYVDTNSILIGNHDTTGTLISGWEYVDSRSLSGFGTDINIAAVSNMPAPPETPAIAPQQGGLLIKILADVLAVPDEELDRTVNLIIQHDFIDHFNLSRPDGSSIGIYYEPFIDTTCWTCMQMCGPDCCSWKKIPVPPSGICDSMIIAPDSSPYINTDTVVLNDGSLTVLFPPQWICGDANSSGSPIIDIVDLSYIVDYLFRGGPAPDPVASADVNCSGLVDVLDITYMVDYLFRQGPELCEGC